MRSKFVERLPAGGRPYRLMRPCLRRVTVDLTPVLPGGDNGGAKLVARSLIRELAVLAPDTEFIVLTSDSSHAELADLDGPNVRRQCANVEVASTRVDPSALAGARLAARVVVDALLPPGARSRVKDAVWAVVKRRRRRQVAASVAADLHFCPFTAPFFFDPRVPLVSIVHDLQFLEFPEFFEPQQLQDRHRHFLDACERADRLICVSEFVRQTVLANSRVRPEAVQTIHSAVLHATRRDPQAASIAREVLAALGVRPSRFLLYPGNAWPHKNHRVLVEAFAGYQRRKPGTDLALVCTGAPGRAFDEITRFSQQVLPPGTFAFAGYLPEREYAALLQSCRALIFPSLYEGFGLPVLEAMACDRPVLCSTSSSLPEIAGDAAVLFDPRDASAIADAIESLETEPAFEAALIQHGRRRAKQFGSAREMAAKYLSAFEDVVCARSGAAAR